MPAPRLTLLPTCSISPTSAGGVEGTQSPAGISVFTRKAFYLFSHLAAGGGQRGVPEQLLPEIDPLRCLKDRVRVHQADGRYAGLRYNSMERLFLWGALPLCGTHGLIPMV